MGDCRGGHFNLDINMIAAVLVPYIEKTPRYPIKDCQTLILNKYHKIVSCCKAYLGRKRAFELVYENWEGSFHELSRFMAAMKHFNSVFIDEWRFEQHEGFDERIFNYVFWTFKPCVDDFRCCRPVISIDGTHVYGKYDIKLLIIVGTDGNGFIFPLAFVVVANDSLDTWTKFLYDLHEYVVCDRQGITLISDRHHGILGSVSIEHNWQSPFSYHRYCLRHLKANYQRAYKSVRLNNLLWAAATSTQEKKILLRMELIKETHLLAYEWLTNIELEKWTLHKDDGTRWGMLTTNSSESFNGLLKSARGLSVTTMVKIYYNMIVDHFVQRSKYAKQLLIDKQEWMPNPFKKFEEYRKKASMHSIQNYLVTDNIFEIRTFNSHHGKGGNKQIVNETQRSCTCGHDKRNCPSKERNAHRAESTPGGASTSRR
ncbi:uncharacterized protein LOC124895377 [Capsicum annuum]|uniref:uncharacterized protein LOC124895377 n=1 Tax=Capsicum annuum TaxID=4072 RepID=UPI001FB062AF|nr:uncharacterized protein LOC124895377 [Capsicum annuum]